MIVFGACIFAVRLSDLAWDSALVAIACCWETRCARLGTSFHSIQACIQLGTLVVAILLMGVGVRPGGQRASVRGHRWRGRAVWKDFRISTVSSDEEVMTRVKLTCAPTCTVTRNPFPSIFQLKIGKSLPRGREHRSDKAFSSRVELLWP